MRKGLLQVHLVLGLAAGLFLLVLGLTGSVMAFENDIDHWLHPRLWHVADGGRMLAEDDLIAAVEQRFAPARVAAVRLSENRNMAQEMQLTDRSEITVNPYTGAVLGRRAVPTRTGVWLGAIHQIHLRLATDARAAWAPAGKVIVSYAGLALFLMVPTGLLLWWRTRRAAIHWRASWFKIFFDAHHAIGIYAGLFLWIAAFTGIVIGFPAGENAIYAATHSAPPKLGRPPASTPVSGATPIGAARALASAQKAIPNAPVDLLLLPLNPKGVYQIILRRPHENSGSAYLSAIVDQFSGRPLVVNNFLTDSEGYRWIRINRAIHTGDIGGLAGHIVVSLSSLLLVAMVVTGLVIWLKKLAV